MSRLIAVPTDFSEVSKKAFPFAADLARRFDADLLLIHVLPPLPYLVGAAAPQFSEYDDAVREQARAELAAVARDPVFEGVEVQTKLAADAPSAPGVVAAIRDSGAILAVMSNHGRRGAARLLLGSVAEEVLRTATVPVLCIGSGQPAARLWEAGGRMLVPVDFSEGSLFALDAAARLASLLDLEIHLAHVVEPPSAPVMLEALPEGFQSSRAELEIRATEKLEVLAREKGLGDRFHVATAFGGAEERLLRMAQSLEPQLIVIGSHGRRGLGRIVLGSVAEGIVRASHCPTLVVKDGSALEQWPRATGA